MPWNVIEVKMKQFMFGIHYKSSSIINCHEIVIKRIPTILTFNSDNHHHVFETSTILIYKRNGSWVARTDSKSNLLTFCNNMIYSLQPFVPFYASFSTYTFYLNTSFILFIIHCMDPKRIPRALLIIYTRGNVAYREEIKPWLWSSSFRMKSFRLVVIYWNDHVWAISVSKNKTYTWMSFVSFMSFSIQNHVNVFVYLISRHRM